MMLHVEIKGQGTDLVLLHGWGMHGGVWRSVCDALAEHCRLHIVDLPGMGHSPPCHPYTLERVAGAVAEYIPPQAVVCGWSLGGEVAMRLALDHPALVGRLILVGSTPCFVNQPNWDCGIDAEVFSSFAAQVAADYHPSMDRFLGLQAFGGESSRQQMRALREHFASRPAPSGQVLRDALTILLETDMREEFAKLPMPLQIVHGNRDTLAPVSAARWMAAQKSRSVLNVIHGASHAPFLSHPGAFVEAVLEFIGTPEHAG